MSDGRPSDASLSVHHDYVDPFSYLMEPALRRLREEGVGIEYLPLERHPPPRPLLDPEAPELVRRWEEEVEPLAAEREIEIRRPSLIPWSRKAHELALHARERGCFGPVHEALYRAHFVEGRDIGRIDVLVEVGVEAGLDVTDARVTLDVDSRADAVARHRREAMEAGIRTVPTTVAGDRRLEGYASHEELSRLLSDE